MSNNKGTELLTPVGRLVQGDCFEGQTTDAEGNPLVIKNGPNAGQPRVDYFMAIAIAKTDPGWPAIWEAIKAEAIKGFPHLTAHIQPLASPADIGQLQFAFKVTDGDSTLPNKKGVVPSSKPGFPGNWVIGFSGGFAPKVYTKGGAELITNPELVKRGYYVRIYGSVKGNGSAQQPGVYLNHSMVELVGYGEEIVTGPSGDAIFGATPAAALPPGASATPLAPQTPIAQQPAQAAAPVATPQPAAQPVATPQPAAQPAQAATPAPSNVQPAPDFLNGPAAAPAAPAQPAAAPAPVEVKRLDANGNAFTEAQLAGAGYTPEMIAAMPVAQ